MNPQPPEKTTQWIFSPERDEKWWPATGLDYTGNGRVCPYGNAGDHLWVKEIHSISANGYFYQTDSDGTVRHSWTSARFMPRAASRITLEVVDVSAMHVQSISADDVVAEGLKCLTKDGGKVYKYGLADRDGWPGQDDDGWAWDRWSVNPSKAFEVLWDSINGRRAPWASNPWVWAITFKRLT